MPRVRKPRKWGSGTGTDCGVPMHIPAPNWRASGAGPCPQPVGVAQGHLHGDVPMQLWGAISLCSLLLPDPAEPVCTQFGSALLQRSGGKELRHTAVPPKELPPVSEMLKCEQHELRPAGRRHMRAGSLKGFLIWVQRAAQCLQPRLGWLAQSSCESSDSEREVPSDPQCTAPGASLTTTLPCAHVSLFYM